MAKRTCRELAVSNIGIIKTIYILAFHKITRSPVGVAMNHTVTQIRTVFAHFVKRNLYPVLATKRNHRWEVVVSHKSHLQCAKSAVSYLCTSVVAVNLGFCGQYCRYT